MGGAAATTKLRRSQPGPPERPWLLLRVGELSEQQRSDQTRLGDEAEALVIAVDVVAVVVSA
jgi:hypothetical protein